MVTQRDASRAAPKTTHNPWTRPLSRCVCDRARCPLRWSFWLFVAPAALALFAGNYRLAIGPLAFGATSFVKYRMDRWHTADLVTVAAGTAALFALNPVRVVPYMCLAYSMAVFCFASHRSCWWHATIHSVTSLGVAVWAVT